MQFGVEFVVLCFSLHNLDLRGRFSAVTVEQFSGKNQVFTTSYYDCQRCSNELQLRY